MKLSENFSLIEFTRSQTATRHGITNTPPHLELQNIIALVNNVLQPLRDEVGRIRVSSGYRGPELNSIIGGSERSQHMSGQAADIECPGMPNEWLFAKILDMDLPVDQLILEFVTIGVTGSGWIHVSHLSQGTNRGSLLRAYKDQNRKTIYEPVKEETWKAWL